MKKQKSQRLAVEWVPIEKLTCNPANPRLNDDAVEHVAASIKRFGWQQPLVAKRSGEVIAGNTRLKAAKSIGEKTAPVVWWDGKDIDAVAYAIADNRTHEFAEWENESLLKLLQELQTEDALDGVGFTPEDIDELFDELQAGGGEVEEDEAPEPPEDPVTKPGDLWLLGGHRVLCGSCLVADDVAKVVGDGALRTVITSPPYFNAREYAHWETVDAYIADMCSVVSLARQHASDLCIVWNIGEQAVHHLDLSSLTSVAFRNEGMLFRDKIAWVKPGAAFDIPRNGHISKGLYYPAFSWEPILVFVQGDHPRMESRFVAEMVQDCTDTWAIETVPSQNESAGFHSAAFPVGLAAKCIKCYSPQDTVVYDPFLGSGTTLIAAEQLGRRCFGLEISCAYCDVIVTRWETLTGKKAILDGTKKTFEKVGRERCK